MRSSRRRRPVAASQRQAQIQYWSLWALAGVAFAGLLIKIALDIQVSRLEQEAVEKQQYVNQTLRVSRLNGQLVQLLANVAASTGDADIKDLLAGQGIQFEVKPR